MQRFPRHDELAPARGRFPALDSGGDQGCVDNPLQYAAGRYQQYLRRIVDSGPAELAEHFVADSVEKQGNGAVGQADGGRGEHPPVDRYVPDPPLHHDLPRNRRDQRIYRWQQDRYGQFPDTVHVLDQACVLTRMTCSLYRREAASEEETEQHQLKIMRGGGRQGAHADGDRVDHGDADDKNNEPAGVAPDRPRADSQIRAFGTLELGDAHASLHDETSRNLVHRVLADAGAELGGLAPYCRRLHAPVVKTPLLTVNRVDENSLAIVRLLRVTICRKFTDFWSEGRESCTLKHVFSNMQIDKEGTARRDGGEEGRRDGIELGHLRQAQERRPRPRPRPRRGEMAERRDDVTGSSWGT